MSKARDFADIAGAVSNGKIASTDVNVSFENINDTGTEGTKVATGTTGQRGSTTGQWRYNTTTGYFEGRGASTFSTLEPTPTVGSVDVSEVDSQAGGNVTIVVTGSNFSSGGTITFLGNAGANFDASTTTYNSVTQVTAVAPKSSFLNAQEPYKVKFTSASGVAGTSGSGLISVDTSPTWSTTSGQIGGTIYEDETFSTTVSATDADGDTITYSLQSGSLPAGSSLNSSTGVINSTNLTAISSDTTSSFTLRATANSKTVDRAFNIVVKDSGIMGSAEAYFDPMNSKSWSGSGTTLTNIGTNSSGNTTNLSLNNQSVATAGGITYIDYNHGNTSNIPTFTLGGINGNWQNYTIAFFGKVLTNSVDGVMFHYGNFTTGQAIGANYSTNNNTMNHYNYSNDYTTPGLVLNTWQFYVLRKVSGNKQVWINNDEKTATSSTQNSTSLPSNATTYYGSRGGSSPYDNGSTDMGMLACWTTAISNTDIATIWNRFKGDYGL